MIIIDCEKMKYPNTGLFFFCDMLVKAIIAENHGVKRLGFYVPGKYEGRWGENFYYKKKNLLDKLLVISLPGANFFGLTTRTCFTACWT